MKELVLENGEFVEIRKMTWGDVVASTDSNLNMSLSKMIVRLTKFDNRSRELESVLQMDYDVLNPVITEVLEQYMNVGKHTKGVA